MGGGGCLCKGGAEPGRGGPRKDRRTRSCRADGGGSETVARRLSGGRRGGGEVEGNSDRADGVKGG